MQKIYTKVVIDMNSGKTLEEESFMYSGPMALCEGENGADGSAGTDGAEGAYSPATLGDILPEDIRGDKLPGSLKDFASVKLPGKDADEKTLKEFHSKIGSAFKSYADTKSMVGGMIKMPGKDAKPEEIAAFREKLGVPKTADDYKIEKPVFPDNKAVFSDELYKGFSKIAHETGMTPSQVQAAVNFQAEMVQSQIKAMDKAAEEGTAALRKEFGDDYDGLIEGAELVVSKFFPETAMEKIKTYGIGNDPDFVRGLIAIHKATAEAGKLRGAGDSDKDTLVASILAEIDTLMKSKEYIDGDKATHEKVAKLFENKQKALGTFKADVRSSKVEI